MGAYFTDVLLSGISFYRVGNITLSAYYSGRCNAIFYGGYFNYEGLADS